MDHDKTKTDQILETVRVYADQSHGQQMRKYVPARYIVHPTRVMELCSTQTGDLPVLAAALLHDVLEDTHVTQGQMLADLHGIMDRELAARTLKLVVELTDVYTKEAYPTLNRNKRKAKETDRLARVSADAQTIKYADIIDNAQEIVQYDRSFAPVFLRECRTLLHAMKKGNSALRKRALEIVEGQLSRRL